MAPMAHGANPQTRLIPNMHSLARSFRSCRALLQVGQAVSEQFGIIHQGPPLEPSGVPYKVAMPFVTCLELSSERAQFSAQINAGAREPLAH